MYKDTETAYIIQLYSYLFNDFNVYFKYFCIKEADTVAIAPIIFALADKSRFYIRIIAPTNEVSAWAEKSIRIFRTLADLSRTQNILPDLYKCR